MATRIEVLDNMPESDLVETFKQFGDFKADIVTAINNNKGKFTIEATFFNTPTVSTLTFKGKMSVFGGADDTGMTPSEGLALFDPADAPGNPDLFGPQPSGTTGLSKRLKADAKYLACRWDYDVTPKSYLKQQATLATVTNTATGASATARPADFGPALDTGRVADLSPALATALGLDTDDDCKVEIAPPPGTPSPASTDQVVGINLAAIDATVFAGDGMARKLVVVTASEKKTYWVVNRIGDEDGGQSLLRRSGNTTKILLSDSTVFPIQASPDIPAAVAAELNKAAPALSAAADGAPLAAGANINAAMFAAAQAFVGKNTDVPGTDHGNLACAWAVNQVARLALGNPISTSGGGNGLSTAEMFTALQAHHTQLNSANDATPGTIIIAPTRGAKHGHVGIVGSTTGSVNATLVYSNSSSAKKFAQNYTIQKFTKRYKTDLGLQVMYFNLK